MKRILGILICLLLLSGCGAGQQEGSDPSSAEPVDVGQITETLPESTAEESADEFDPEADTAGADNNTVNRLDSAESGSIGTAAPSGFRGGNASGAQQLEAAEPYDPDGEPAFVVSSASVKAGSTAEVTVRLRNNPGIAGILLYVTYDPALVLEEAIMNPSLIGETVEPGSLDNPVPLVWISPYEDMWLDAELVTLKFSVPKGTPKGEYRVCVSYEKDDVYNIEEEPVEFTAENGVISVL